MRSSFTPVTTPPVCTLSTPRIISLSSDPGRDGALLRSGRAVRFAVNLPAFYDRQVAARCYSTASIMPVSKTGSRIQSLQGSSRSRSTAGFSRSLSHQRPVEVLLEAQIMCLAINEDAPRRWHICSRWLTCELANSAIRTLIASTFLT